ncbi:MAG: hypothetical protein CVV64_16440 [Candidatus Wallbacteria bacterium HGW-Wallbacteria-1]|jgi:Ser/Thr protein kinase RdoA (MazF antagonist)|uniref:Aminoglycoside phosphotransferase domain-containing protein n=1 Tax=Candidatus Wallbacteria bacterium HGW-Wallbacteria-1 TaxID=2013854 RepID=A0A2N1PKT7_9BACT|nr:MAG: hypothetical protein CVV64_16440 [Candidatus Wallbacteria bacterium HGW-Wallbacteria-1]
MEKWIDELMNPSVIDIAMDGWGLCGKPLLLGDCENYVYQMPGDSSENFILRVTHSSHRTAREVESEFHWMDHLVAEGAPICSPLASAKGFRTLEIPASDGSVFTAAVFREARGSWVMNPAIREEEGQNEESRSAEFAWGAQVFRRWGEALGVMHRATVKYSPNPALPQRPHWKQDDLIVNSRIHLSSDALWIADALEEVSLKMESLLTGNHEFSEAFVVHADLHHGNFLYTPEGLRVFDFDDCCRHYLAFDLALPVYYVFFPELAVNGSQKALETLGNFIAPYLQGYLDEFPMARESIGDWLTAFPTIMRFRDSVMSVFCAKKGYSLGNRRLKDIRDGTSYDVLEEFLKRVPDCSFMQKSD